MLWEYQTEQMSQRGEAMDPILTGAAGAALTEGVKYLYQQAAEILSSWRARSCFCSPTWMSRGSVPMAVSELRHSRVMQMP